MSLSVFPLVDRVVHKTTAPCGNITPPLQPLLQVDCYQKLLLAQTCIAEWHVVINNFSPHLNDGPFSNTTWWPWWEVSVGNHEAKQASKLRVMLVFRWAKHPGCRTNTLSSRLTVVRCQLSITPYMYNILSISYALHFHFTVRTHHILSAYVLKLNKKVYLVNFSWDDCKT
jgi:hypothetical protein